VKIITIEIDEKGDSEIDLAGFNGKGCAAIQEGFARAVGTATEVGHKPEFNKPCKTENKLQQRS
jgi:hypothetical protein